MPDSLTHSQRKDRATQLLIKYKSGALVTQLSDLGLGDPVEVTEPDARSSFPHVLHLHLKLLRLRRKMLPLMFTDFISL